MKKYTLLCMASLLWAGLYAQDHYYYYKGEKQCLILDKTRLDITTSTHFQKEQMRCAEFEILSLNNDLTYPNILFGSIKLQSEHKDTKYEEIITLLKNNKDVIAVHPNFITSRNIEIGMSPYFYVRLKEASDYDLLKKLTEQKNVVIVEQNRFLPLWYTLICTKETPDNTLNIANYFFETGLFASAVPDFLSNDLGCTNDPDFSQLWGLHNTSHPNIDINACAAWDITRGNGITVAVLDGGIDSTHIDLQANISSLSYDTESNSSPSLRFGGHGTHCAGIIGAVGNNDTQIVGVAPECTLMSISNSLYEGSTVYLAVNSRIKRADGINWAWKNGADIINNSWMSAVQYDVIDEAIDSALVYGRNGKGCVMVFCSHNQGSSVTYPATLPNVIAVGAIDMNGTRADFSNYGTELDVVAPGDGILSTVPNNNTDIYSGTSMAAPHVAGVAALVLSANPILTAQQVRDIIESTCQKVYQYSPSNPLGYTYSTSSGRPNGTWNNEMGYGLVNAFAAVQKACETPYNFINQTVNSNTTIESCGDIFVKDITIKSGATLILKAAGNVIIEGDFDIELGAGFEIW